ncbi:helix-turn-helix transcriptional regulator [Erythrobacter sp.]|uniref:ArsR/SmtB family transcription factor n=1 Tax=Erythrobacter sp. TaxID=1042 RepID=UPI001425C40C|nr:metalloregulator ArsR/SmtB family transcription factor [Erythrobacter sp.]QIQ87106.1 MAG: helix-turn-helix transcriptional regulator [Erythrobacter sp.]
MSDEPPIEELKAIAHPLRFRILEVLGEGELSVGEIDRAADIGQPALSQQLGVLRKAGLVETRKEAKLVYYSLASEPIARLARALGAIAGGADAGVGQEPEARRTPAPGVANFARLT